MSFLFKKIFINNGIIIKIKERLGELNYNEYEE